VGKNSIPVVPYREFASKQELILIEPGVGTLVEGLQRRIQLWVEIDVMPLPGELSEHEPPDRSH